MNIKLIDIAILEVLSTDMNKYFLCFSCTRKVLSAIVSANWKWLLFLWVFQIKLVPSHGILPLFWQGCFVGGHRNSTGKQLSEEMATKTWYKHNLFFSQKSNKIFGHTNTITTTSSLLFILTNFFANTNPHLRYFYLWFHDIKLYCLFPFKNS